LVGSIDVGNSGTRAPCCADDSSRTRLRINWNQPLPPPVASNSAPAPATGLVFAAGPPTLTFAPATIAGDFRGYIDVQIASLDSGETVRLEKFQVNNTSGLVDASAVLVESLLLTDGQDAVIGGVTNHNVVADLTPADGKIIAELSFLDAFLPNMAGEYVFRLSSPSNRFAPITSRFSVTPAPAAQQISGTVTAGGANVPYAYIALFRAEGGSYEFVAGTVADAQGAYSIPAPPGSYHLLEGGPGFVGNFAAKTTLVRLTAGVNSVVNPVLTAGTRTISGRLRDASNSAFGLPGVQLLLRNADQTRLVIAYSDAEGNWSAAVTPDEWEVEVLAWSVTQIGFVGLVDPLFADTTAASVSNLTVSVPRADAILRGTVASDGKPLPFVVLNLFSQDGKYWLTVSTDRNGAYTAAVSAGSWRLELDPESLESLGYAGSLQSLIPLTTGQVVTANFAPLSNTTHLEGSVVNQLGDPVPGMSFTAIGPAQSYVAGEADENGAFSISVPNGEFRFEINLEMLAEYDLIEVQAAPLVTNGADVTGLKLLLKAPTAHLTVHVIDQFGRPVTHVPLLADTLIGGAVHNSFDFTDEKGDVRLPVLNGTWTLQLNGASEFLKLESYGYASMPNRNIPVTGGDLTNQLQLTLLRPPQLLNIATRLRVQTGDNVLIGGFIITGTDPKKVMVRGIGPSLASFFPDFLADPTLELYQGNTLLATNDNWKTKPDGSSQQAEIEATTIPPTNDLESALLRTLPAGSAGYTAIVRGKNNTTGMGVVETYDLDTTVNSKLANISTRGLVETGNNVLIGGLIPGNGGTKVIVRAIGPSLTNAGVTNPLQDPTLELHDGNGGTIRSNDNWKIREDGSSQQAEIEATTIPPTNDLESALVANLQPGNYTAVVRGKNNTIGIAVVEVYNIQ
jgi:hypothetical protein